MASLRERVDDLVYEIKQENPNANWRNLLTGITILVLVGVFSIWYFSNSSKEKDLIDQLKKGNGLQVEGNLATNNSYDDILGATAINEEGMVEVLKGEGLWHVAKRVCGDGEKYKYIADANNMNIHRTKLVPGQMIKIDCGE